MFQIFWFCVFAPVGHFHLIFETLQVKTMLKTCPLKSGQLVLGIMPTANPADVNALMAIIAVRNSLIIAQTIL
jgi:hypothetical protein